jgi:hypothetical protein
MGWAQVTEEIEEYYMLKTFGQILITQLRTLQMCFMPLKHMIELVKRHEHSEGRITFDQAF